MNVKKFINDHFITDEITFESRILNFVCLLGILACLSALISRLIAGLPLVSVIPLLLMIAAISCIFLISVRQAKHAPALTTIIVCGVSIVFWPLLFFTIGGPSSGMAVYFTLAIILDFMLLKGKVRAFALTMTFLVTVICYASTIFWGWRVWPENGLNTHQQFIDTIQSILIVGFLIGIIIMFQTRLYQNEKKKAESANEVIKHSEELLSLINEAAVTLLTAEPDKFEAALSVSMEKIATCIGIDCTYIWRAGVRDSDSTPVYILLHEWLSPNTDMTKTFKTITGSNLLPRTAELDNLLINEQGYLSGTVKDFSGEVHDIMMASGVKMILTFSVFFQGRYWGFVSFENRHNENVCSDREVAILQSGSLLLANAIERNESMQQLNERLAQQQLMSDISKSFISKESIEKLVLDALAKTGTFLKVERVLITVLEHDSAESEQEHPAAASQVWSSIPFYVWCTDPKYTLNASQKELARILSDLFPRHHDDRDDSPSIYCDNTCAYADGKFCFFYEQGGIKSFICAPIYVEGDLWGVLSIEELGNFRRWNKNDSMLISTVASAISNAISRDIIDKERNIALERALQASRAKGDFLSNMSHEIRTPMNAIIGMTSIGLSAADIDRMRYCFKKIDNASKHLLGIINDILDISKIEANKLELSPVSFEFEKLLQSVVNIINFRVDEHKQRFFVNIGKDIPSFFYGDDQRLAQVITNLLSNAVKFTPEGGSITFSSQLVSESEGICCLQMSVADTGIGITEDQKTRLFNSFEQAEAGTTRKYGGTGLGLAICKRIVELMGGDIWVESEQGKGSKFIFTVNLKRDYNERKQLLAEGVNWSNIRIFAVDDEPEIRKFFLDTAEAIGISCTVAASGEEAAEMLQNDDNYDIYFLDWMLPGINGVELAKKIQKKSIRKYLVVIFSSIDWSVIEDDARSAGIEKFLSKPLFPSMIVNLINECIGLERVSEQFKKDDMPDDFSGHKILLAEDVEINREIVSALLEPTSVEIDFAENGKQAVKMFGEAPEKYGMIFMDVQMPEMDGYEATRRIRALNLPRAKEIPVVAMTANVFKEDIEQCMKAGMNDHVGKPIDLDEVLSMLRKYLAR